MSDRTTISWTDATWSPVSGCTKVSPGCDHCYIERTPPFRMVGRRFDQPGIGGTTGVQRHGDRLFQPFHWRKPRRVFVCSLADLFHKDVPDLFIAKVWATMARTQQHTYQVLTKRPARMRALLSSHDFELLVEAVCSHHDFEWPLPNVWVGVSAEDQKRADERIPVLMETPAAVRWVSVEPMLGPVDLEEWLWVEDESACGDPDHCSPMRPAWLLDWVVSGGESGPGARPAPIGWHRELRDQCEAAGVAYHYKQAGEWTSTATTTDPWLNREPDVWVNFYDGHAVTSDTDPALETGSWSGMWKVGKKAAGRLLDGRTHDDYPTTTERTTTP